MPPSDAQSGSTSHAGDHPPRAEPLVREALNDLSGPVRRYLFGVCGDRDLAEELAQEALLKAWQNRDGFGGRSSVGTWVFAIARNHWLDRLRRRKSAPKEEPMNMESPPASTTPHPPAQAWRGELAAAMKLAMDKLPAEQRDALALRESDGLTFGQIAEMLNLPVPTVKSRVRYALLKLADELRPFERDLGGDIS